MEKLKKNEKIYIKDTDKSREVLFYSFRNDLCFIKFRNNPSKVYSYSKKAVKIIKDETQKEREELVNKRFNYFLSVSSLGKEEEEDNISSLLFKYLKAINLKSDKTLLLSYLTGVMPEEKKEDLTDKLIYPFGFNLSQKQAVKNAVGERVSVIEGPPGTGKTQTILNIICQAVMEGRTVAMVSASNEAVRNVAEKLEKEDLSFITSFLGSKNNKENFLENQKSITLDPSWLLSKKDFYSLKDEVLELEERLTESLSAEREGAEIKERYNELQIERKHFEEDFIKHKDFNVPKKMRKIKDPSFALRLNLFFTSLENLSPLLDKINNALFKLRILRGEKALSRYLMRNYPREYLSSLAKNIFYERESERLKGKIEKFEGKAKSLERYNEEYRKKAMTLFKHILYSKFSRQSLSRIFTDPYAETSEFLTRYPVILSTTFSAAANFPKKIVFDYVIVDEASQVDLCTALLSLSIAKNIVIVGDEKQLPPVIEEGVKEQSALLFNKYSPGAGYDYSKESLLSSVIKVFPRVKRTLLREHYRCHPMIIGFCNKQFYDNALIILTKGREGGKPLKIYRTALGNHARWDDLNKKMINTREAETIEEIIQKEHLNMGNSTFGIISPYRAQSDLIESMYGSHDIKSATVDRFQGQERDSIILSLTGNKINAFIDNPNRLNVAVSRARDNLIIVMTGNEIPKDSNIDALIKYIEYNNCEVENSALFSVFDYLYKCNEEERKRYLKDKRRVSKYDSENLMYSVIEDVLKARKGLSVSVHVPLSLIFRDKSVMDENERKYASNPLTHVDFLIYNSLHKTPLLAVEVDGSAYHKEGSAQKERDRIKDNIFKKYNLGIARFSTDESGLEEKLSYFINREEVRE